MTAASACRAASAEADAAVAPVAGPVPSGQVPGPVPGRTTADTARALLSSALVVAILLAAAWLHTAAGFGATASFSLLAGLALGILFERGRFCFYCIFRDLFEHGNSRGVYSILTALAVGSLGYVFVFTLRLPDAFAGRLPGGAHVAPVSLALVVAGVAFGLGLVLSGACIAGHIYRLGEGYLRAIPGLSGVLVGFGLGFLTWNPFYTAFIRDAPSPWLPAWFGYGGALVIQLAVLAVIGLLLLRWNPPLEARAAGRITAAEVRRRLFFERWPALLTGALVGIVGVLAYLRGQPLGVTSQLSGLTRTTLDGAGLLPDRLLGLDQTLAGCVALVTRTITDNGWLVVGILVGSLAAALPGRRFAIEPLTLRNGFTALLGGVLLGWGAITGLGCTIGVFLSGTQALALSGWVFAAAVLAALAFGFRFDLHRIH